MSTWTGRNDDCIYDLRPSCIHPHNTHPSLSDSMHTQGMIYDQFFDFSRQLNVNVMAYEYSGYGKASGSPSEQACYADIDAAFKYLVEVKLPSSSPSYTYRPPS